MLYKGKLDQIIMCLYVEVICKIQTMYVTNLRSGLEYIVKEQNDLAKDYYKKIAQPVRVMRRFLIGYLIVIYCH